MCLVATPQVSKGSQVPVLSPNGHPNPLQGRHKSFRKSGIFQNFSADACQHENGNVGVFGGPMVRATGARTWVPMDARVPVLSPNDHANPSQGRQKGLGKGRLFENLHRMHASVKMAESSPARAHRGAIRGYMEFGPHHWLGGPYTKKTSSGPGSESTHSSCNTQKSFDPPSPIPSPINDFARGWTPDITHWGLLRKRPPTGLVYGACA